MLETGRKRGRPALSKELDLNLLYEAAINEFAAKGFDGSSLSSIAKKAGVTRTLINYYFGTKEELWQRSVEEMMQDLVQDIRDELVTFKDVIGVPLLKVVVRRIIYFFAQNPQYMRIASHELFNKTERADWLIENLLTPIFELTAPVFKTELVKGTIKRIPRANQIAILFGMSTYFFNNTYLMNKSFNVNPFTDEEIEKHADAVIEIFFSGICNK